MSDKKLKIMSIFGTRPEAIKMAPLIKAMEKCEHIEPIVCVTAQHREMLDQVLEIFSIKPDVDLDIMQSGQTLTGITTKALTGLEKVFEEHRPDLVLVHGDTTTTFSAAIAAYYAKIPVGHVEAGLRTYDKFQPYPEEMNRCLTGVLADLHFSPTRLAKNNLLKENTIDENIFITGNTSIDCLKTTLSSDYEFKEPILKDIDFWDKRVIVMTAHRRENLGQPLINICNAVLEIADKFSDVEFVYAVHLSPAVKDTVYKMLGNHKQIHLTPPLDMVDMHNLMNKSHLVLTDSGGLQEEVPSMGKPVLVLRNVTERPEGVISGVLKPIGTDKDRIVNEATTLLESELEYKKMIKSSNPFGDGNASNRIINAILYYFEILDEKPSDYTF